MFGSSILDMAIGLMFFYFLLSTLCATLNEWVAAVLSWRARTLEQGIRQLLSDPSGEGLSAKVYQHPLVRGLGQRERRPSYIPARTFASALVEVLSRPSDAGPGKAGAKQVLSDLQAAVLKLPAGSLRESLLGLLGEGKEADLLGLRANIERWFDDAMDRVSGWYKRKAQRSILLLSLALSVVINGDTLSIANALWRDPILRESFSAAAREWGRAGPVKTTQVQGEIEKLQPPLGWRSPVLPKDGRLWWLVSKVLGLCLTALFVSLGAPFWFDLLNRVSNLRAAGPRPAPSG